MLVSIISIVHTEVIMKLHVKMLTYVLLGEKNHIYFNYNTFSSVVNDMQLSVWKHHIQFTLKYILLKYRILFP